MYFGIVYLYICSVLQRVAYESFEEDIDFQRVEFAYIIENIVLEFRINLGTKKAIAYTDYTWFSGNIDFSILLWIFSDELQR